MPNAEKVEGDGRVAGSGAALYQGRVVRYGWWLPLLIVAMTVSAGGVILFGLSILEDRLLNQAGQNLRWAAMEIAGDVIFSV
jgi:hypothetical protein